MEVWSEPAFCKLSLFDPDSRRFLLTKLCFRRDEYGPRPCSFTRPGTGPGQPAAVVREHRGDQPRGLSPGQLHLLASVLAQPDRDRAMRMSLDQDLQKRDLLVGGGPGSPSTPLPVQPLCCGFPRSPSPSVKHPHSTPWPPNRRPCHHQPDYTTRHLTRRQAHSIATRCRKFCGCRSLAFGPIRGCPHNAWQQTPAAPSHSTNPIVMIALVRS